MGNTIMRCRHSPILNGTVPSSPYSVLSAATKGTNSSLCYLAERTESTTSLRRLTESVAPVSAPARGALALQYSAGISTFPDQGATAVDLIGAADEAVYEQQVECGKESSSPPAVRSA